MYDFCYQSSVIRFHFIFFEKEGSCCKKIVLEMSQYKQQKLKISFNNNFKNLKTLSKTKKVKRKKVFTLVIFLFS